MSHQLFGSVVTYNVVSGWASSALHLSNNLTVPWLVCELVQHFISASSNLTVHWLVCCMCGQVQHSVSASSYLCAEHVDRFSILFPQAVTSQCIDLCAVCVNKFSAVSAITGECSDFWAVWTCSSVASQQLLGSMCRAYVLCMNISVCIGS